MVLKIGRDKNFLQFPERLHLSWGTRAEADAIVFPRIFSRHSLKQRLKLNSLAHCPKRFG